MRERGEKERGREREREIKRERKKERERELKRKRERERETPWTYYFKKEKCKNQKCQRKRDGGRETVQARLTQLDMHLSNHSNSHDALLFALVTPVVCIQPGLQK